MSIHDVGSEVALHKQALAYSLAPCGCPPFLVVVGIESIKTLDVVILELHVI